MACQDTTPRTDFMRRALELAGQNIDENGGPFGAVIAYQGQIIAEGTNRVVPDNDPVSHAEINAIRKACKSFSSFSLKGCELYTSCEPCPMCLGAIYWARLDRVFYAAGRKQAARAGFDDEFIYEEFDISPSQRSVPMVNFLGEEADSIFAKWEQTHNKTFY